MNGFLQVSEQVWVPIHTIVRVSEFAGVVTVTTTHNTETFDGEDATRILLQLKPLL